MTAHDTGFNLELSRRKLIAAAGVAGGAVLAASLIGTGNAEAAPTAPPVPDPVATPPVAGLHLQFGADASSEMVVSWHTLQPVHNPRVVLGHLDGKLEQTAKANETSYTDAKSGQIVYAYHAKLDGLRPDSPYLYGQCTMARRRSSARSIPLRVVARRSRSPALAIKARRPLAGSLCRRPE
jgi:phosphodiesterase/alkaline phosphatase D-like protein